MMGSKETAGVVRGGRTRRSFLLASGMVGLEAVLGSRAWASEPHPLRMPYNTLSDDDEIELGKIVAADLEKQLQFIQIPLVDSYLNNIVQNLAKASQRPNMPYHCKLVNTEVINAFSIAGGGIYLNRGLVEFIEKEDQLVATLAHEIGHVVGRHSANQMMLNFRAQQAYELVRSNIPEHARMIEQMIEKMGGILAVLAMLHFSRENELEADMLGFYEMLRAGYQPAGMLDMFQMLAAIEQKQPSSLLSPLLRDHPPSAERAKAVQRELTEVTVPRGASEDTFQFQAFKLAMTLLPAAPKPVGNQP